MTLYNYASSILGLFLKFGFDIIFTLLIRVLAVWLSICTGLGRHTPWLELIRIWVHLFLQRCPPSPSGYTPRGLTSGQRREARYGFSCFITTSKQTKKARCDRSITVDKLVITQICECIDEDLQSITQISTWMEKKLVHAFVMCVPCNRLGSIPRCSPQYSPRSLCPGIVWWFLWCVSKCLISVVCTICKLTVDESVQSKISVGKKEWVQFWLNLILYQDSSGIV